MKKYSLLIAGLATVPNLALAQGASITTLLSNTINFISEILIPFLFGVAFLIFIINVVRFFVLGGSNEEGRKKAKDLAIYSVAAFSFLVIFWGLVNLLSTSIGLGGQTQPCPDYILKFDPTKCP